MHRHSTKNLVKIFFVAITFFGLTMQASAAQYCIKNGGTATKAGSAVASAAACSAAANSGAMSIATHNAAGAAGFAAGDTVWISSAGGTLYGPLVPPSTQGTSGSPITYSAISGETPPHIRATTITTGWVASSTAPTIYSVSVTNDPTFSSSRTFGVWEDEAPLLSARLGNTAEAMANMRPGTFFWSAGTLYVWTYEGTSPAAQTMEVSVGSTPYALNISDVNHLRVNGLWLERAQNAGVIVQGNSSTVDDVIFNKMIILDNDSGYKASGAGGIYSTSVQLNNSDIVHNAFTSIILPASKNATVTAKNSVFGNTLGTVPLAIQSTGILNIGSDSIVIGHPGGRYWLSQYSGGTVNGTPTYLNPQFKNAGATTGLSAALLSVGRSTDDAVGGTLPIAYNMLTNLKSINAAFNMSEQLATQWVENLMHSSGLTVTQAWAQQQQYVALGGEVTPAGRNHIRWATGSFGTDYTNIFTLKYSPVTTTATTAFDGRYLTTTLNGVQDLHLDTTNTSFGGYDLSILGFNAGTKTGVAGWLAANKPNYTFVYSNPGPADTQPASFIGTMGKIASSVLATQSNININNVFGNFAMNTHASATATNLWGTELWDSSSPFAAGNTWMTDYNTGIVSGGGTALVTPPTTFSWPYSHWSLDEIKILGNTYGVKGSVAGIYNSTNANAALNLYNQFYPAAMPIIFPESSAECFDFGGGSTTGCHTGYSSAAASTAQGIAEGENQAAFLSAWDASTQIFGENYGTTVQDLNASTVTSYAQTLNTYGIPIKQISYPGTSLISAGATYDSNTTYITKKIVPTYDFTLNARSPGIDAGTTVSGLTADILGNPIYGTPDLGGYEYQPPYTFATNYIPTTGSVRLYSNGQYRALNASSTASTASFSIAPVGGSYTASTSQYMDISISNWSITGSRNKEWIATSTTGTFNTHATSTVYTIGDMANSTYYTFKLDGTASTTAIIDNIQCTSGVCLSDASGNITFTYQGGYSTHTFNFTILDVTPPGVFSLSSPADNASSADGQPPLSWTASTDFGSGLAKYQLYINGVLNRDNISTSLTSTTPTTSLVSGSYTWFVRAVDDNGNFQQSSQTYTLNIAKVFYVDNVLGNDANPGTQASPWASLSYAGATALAGDTVIIIKNVGTPYRYETLAPSNSGTLALPITFRGVDANHKPEIWGSDETGNGNGDWSVSGVGGAGDTYERYTYTFSGFSNPLLFAAGMGALTKRTMGSSPLVLNPGEWFWISSPNTLYYRLSSGEDIDSLSMEAATQDNGIASTADYIHYKDIIVRYADSAGVSIAGTGQTAQGIEVHDSVQGIRLEGTNSVLNDVIVTGNNTAGIYVVDPVNATINNSLAYGNGANGITFHISSSIAITLKNNISAGNTGYSFGFESLSGTPTFTASNNLWDIAGDSNWTTYKGTNNKELVNPLFTNPNAGDFTLQSLSPAIDAGTTITGITTDILGNSMSGTPDIGPYEYQHPAVVSTPSVPVASGGGPIMSAGSFTFNVPKPRLQMVVNGKVTYLDVPASIPVQTPIIAPSILVFTHPLMRGSHGSDVSSLQKLLKKDRTIYPEGIVNGNFGPATERALKRFQKKYGIATPGVAGYGLVGPKTRAKLNSLSNE